MFSEKVRQLILIATAVEIAVGSTILTIYTPFLEHTWHIYFGFRRALPEAMALVAIGLVLASLVRKKPDLAVALQDSICAFALILVTRIAMWVAFQITLPIGCKTPWSNSVQMLGGLKIFQILYFAMIAFALPAMVWATGFMVEGVLVVIRKIRNARMPRSDASGEKPFAAAPIDISIKHRYPCANAVHRLRVAVKEAVHECLQPFGDVNHTIKWSGADLSTVHVDVSLGDPKTDINLVAYAISERLAYIDAKDVEAVRAQANWYTTKWEKEG